MSTIKLNTNYVCLGHLATKKKLAQLAANQSEHTTVAI